MKKTTKNTILFLTLIMLPVWNLFGSELKSIQWKEISHKDNITVFQAKNFKHSSGLVPIKFKAKLNHNIAKVLTVLSDNPRKTEWLPKAKEAKVIDRKSISEYTVYYRYDAPWPFKDRDFIIYNQADFKIKDLSIYVVHKSITDQKMPEQKGAVRGTAHDGYSSIRPLGLNETEVEIAFLNDFGGFIPKFVQNLVGKKWPYKFMKNLKAQLNKKDIEINPEFILKNPI